MIKPFMILNFILISTVIFSQERFYYLYDGWTINKIELINNDYYSFGLSSEEASYGYSIQFNIFDNFGSVTNSFIYSIDENSGFSISRSGSYLIKGDTVLIVGTYVNSTKSNFLSSIFIKYSLDNHELIDTCDYRNILGYSMGYLIDSVDNHFVMVSDYDADSKNSFPVILFITATGDTLSTKRYAFLPLNSIRRRVFPYQLLKLPDGGYILSCEDAIGQYMYQQQRAWFLRLDSQGNELWRRATSTTDTMCYRPFAFLTQNDYYIITWSDPFLYEEVLNPDLTMWLAKMSDNGIISGRHKISDDIEGFPLKMFYVNDYHQDSFGNIFIMGEMTYPYNGFLIKINPQGHAVWFREYECFPENDAEGDWTKLYGLTPTPDGGFIMGGEYMSPDSEMFPGGIQKSLAIKVDSCGCLEEGCNSLCNVNIGQQFITAQNVVIYPNPATDFVNIELNTFAKTVNVQVFDAEGCLWINTIENSELNNPAKFSLDVSGLAAGSYVVNIWADGKLFWGKFVKV
ncbi:MAG TPA: T9SS type A sorting domain-containing protein [Bacteroidales bacterium]|nr:T9SS type A sorting domain-containing protein [Bacteroidales bacterium]